MARDPEAQYMADAEWRGLSDNVPPDPPDPYGDD
jgi:hypothetical protein